MRGGVQINNFFWQQDWNLFYCGGFSVSLEEGGENKEKKTQPSKQEIMVRMQKVKML